MLGRTSALPFLAGAALLLALAGSTPTTASSQQLRYSESEVATPLNPYARPSAHGVSDRFFATLYEPLYRYDYLLQEYRPILADTFWVDDDGAVMLRVKDGVQWHDGVAMTAADVAFTYDYITTRSPNHAERVLVQSIVENVEAVDRLQVRFTLTPSMVGEDPRQLFERWIIPAHRFQENGADLDPPLSEEPIGTGPFALEERLLNGDIVSQRFNGHHGIFDLSGQPLRGLELRVNPETSTMVQQLIGGGVHLLPQVPPEYVPQLEENDELSIVSFTDYQYYSLVFNYQHSALVDADVRRAIQAGFNRRAVLQNRFRGEGSLLAGPLVPHAPFANLTLAPIPFDGAEAQRLLDEGGYRDRNADGVREDGQGDPLRLELILPVPEGASEATSTFVAEAFRTDMERLGIEIQVTPLPRDAYELRFNVDRDFDLAYAIWEFDPIYDISEIFRTEGSRNNGGYTNPELDATLDDYLAATDRERRQALMYTAQQILADDLPQAFLFTADKYTAHVVGLALDIDPFFFFSNIGSAYVIRGMRLR